MNLRLGRVNLGYSLILTTLIGLIGGSGPLSAQEPRRRSSSEEVEDPGRGSVGGSRGMLFCVRPGQARGRSVPPMLNPGLTVEAFDGFGVSSFGPETLARRSESLPPAFPTEVGQMDDWTFELASDPDLQLTRILVCTSWVQPSALPESE
ncbi:hypothetical protein E1H12_16010 [Geitlerinema sp. P-1104]|uniref:hypothetical protein n=1 Tax=Geitlerinema sp. P-1104 TaxID=2546230 RepID=UPI0014773BAD|nr:hypothetical protein [Geitlerinema sp. P-1104]NMG59981.1 hypothetical protein [Geitlerinema sp. P-1104]